jgi:hypothetical protein
VSIAGVIGTLLPRLAINAKSKNQIFRENQVCAIAPHFSFNSDRLLFKGNILNNSTLSQFKLSPVVVLYHSEAICENIEPAPQILFFYNKAKC